MREYDESVLESYRTARTLYNKNDAFGVKHDTESKAEQNFVRHSPGQNIARTVLIKEAASRKSVTSTK